MYIDKKGDIYEIEVETTETFEIYYIIKNRKISNKFPTFSYSEDAEAWLYDNIEGIEHLDRPLTKDEEQKLIGG